mmetsp:Transcript_121678/g.351261  ORF Transcript_121678/g.351261 Transcript_121678/m.351261 type:complete len:239 (-) Transcript_121678:1346-2062(-)
MPLRRSSRRPNEERRRAASPCHWAWRRDHDHCHGFRRCFGFAELRSALRPPAPKSRTPRRQHGERHRAAPAAHRPWHQGGCCDFRRCCGCAAVRTKPWSAQWPTAPRSRMPAAGRSSGGYPHGPRPGKVPPRQSPTSSQRPWQTVLRRDSVSGSCWLSHGLDSQRRGPGEHPASRSGPPSGECPRPQSHAPESSRGRGSDPHVAASPGWTMRANAGLKTPPAPATSSCDRLLTREDCR